MGADDGRELPPLFMLVGEYAEMWRAWKFVQASGRAEMSGPGWRVSADEREGGGSTMRLEVDFEPIARPAGYVAERVLPPRFHPF